MRRALRGCAVLSIAVGIAVVAPVERVQRAGEERAGIDRAGERGDAPAIRHSAGVDRRAGHAPVLALAPRPATTRPPAVRALDRLPASAGCVRRAPARCHGARAPPPLA